MSAFEGRRLSGLAGHGETISSSGPEQEALLGRWDMLAPAAKRLLTRRFLSGAMGAAVGMCCVVALILRCAPSRSVGSAWATSMARDRLEESPVIQRFNPAEKVWCDFNECRSVGKGIRGVNYGGRFVPEKYLGLYLTDDILFKDIHPPDGIGAVGLCDVDVEDAAERMSKFLDGNINHWHFKRMHEQGFNVVRVPVGYWNLIDLPDERTPHGPDRHRDRWRSLHRIMPAENYTKWIDKVFLFAQQSGLQVLLDLHSTPGGQSGNMNTGCSYGHDDVFFLTEGGPGYNNFDLGVQAIEAMGRTCAAHGDTCWGIELLNEPFGAAGQGKLKREVLAKFYEDGIKAARTHLPLEKPVVIMEWPNWLHFWKNQPMYHYDVYGRVLFSSHFYQWPNPWTSNLSAAQDSFVKDLDVMHEFFAKTRYEIFVSEYALNSHGSGDKQKDEFDYHGLINWFVQEFDKRGFGAIVWNYDSYWSAWGPVGADQVGKSVIDWASINGKDHRGRGWARGRGRGRGRGKHPGESWAP